MIKKISDIITMDTLSCFLVLGLFFQYCFPFSKTTLNILCTIIGCLLLYEENIHFRLSKNTYLIFISVSIATIINHYLIGNLSLSFVIKFIFQYYPIAYWFAINSKKNTKNWLFISLLILFIIEVSWFFSPDKYILFDDLSRNYVSIFLLVIVFIFINILNSNIIIFPLNIILPFIYLFLSIHAIGRGGILTGILYLTITSIYVYKTNNKVKEVFFKRRKQLFYVCLILFILFFVMYGNQIFNLFFSRFVDTTAQNSDIGRMNVYTTYFKMAFSNVKYFLLGVPYSEISSRLSFITGNLHCSYLQLHSCFGIAGVIFVFYRLHKTIIFLLKYKKHYNLIFLTVFLFRILTDFAVCGFITDFIMTYYLILPMVVRGDKYEPTHYNKSNF